jgi:hypothetical protein
MEFRFRYLGPEGGEIEVSSLEDLRALVTAGKVEETTLLYDALTKEWAPARAHAVYRFMRDEAARAGGARPPSASDDLGLGITLSLEAAPDVPDADEAVRELLKERERDNEPQRGSGGGMLSWDASKSRVAPVAPAPAAPTAPPSGSPPPVSPPKASAASSPPAARGSEPHLMTSWEREATMAAPVADPPPPAPAKRRAFAFTSAVPQVEPHPPRRVELPVERPLFHTVAPPAEKPARTFEWAAASLYRGLHVNRVTAWLDDFGRHLLGSLGPRALPGTLVLAGLVGVLFVLLTSARNEGSGSSEPAVRASVMSVGPEVGRLVNRFASAEESGFQSMVAGVDSLRRVHGIAEVPRIWLEGAYLADAPRYPEVRDFWTRYRTFLHDVEASDTALFRAGFVRSLEDQGIGGAVLSLRLSQALREFEKSQPRRDDVYRHMEELSSAALDLHALLVNRADDITYEPAIRRGSTISREPVVEAVAEDTLLKDHMWTLLERIFASLEWMGGDLGGSRDNLTNRLLEGIEASAR